MLFDFFFGGLGAFAGLVLFRMAGDPDLPPAAATSATVAGGVTLLMSLALLGMGALLFTRKLWAYQIAFFGHVALFLLQVLNTTLVFTQNNGPDGAQTNVGIPIFGLILAGLCANLARKLVQQEREFEEIMAAAQSIPRKSGAVVDAKKNVQTGWDQPNPKPKP